MPASTINGEKLCLFTQSTFDYAEENRPDRENASFDALRCILNASDQSEVNFKVNAVGDPDCPDLKADLRYEIPVCEVKPKDCFAMDCKVPEEVCIEYGYDQPTINDCVNEAFSFDFEKFKCDFKCFDPNAEYTKVWRRHVLSLMKQYQTKAIVKIAQGAGSFHPEGAYAGADSTLSPGNLPLWTLGTPSVPQPMAFGLIADEYKRQGCDDNVYVLTSSRKVSMFEYAKTICKDDNGCFNPNNVDDNGLTYCLDTTVPIDLRNNGITAAADPIITFCGGAFKILEWNCYADEAIASRDGEPLMHEARVLGRAFKQTVDVGSIFFGVPFVVDLLIYMPEDCKNKVMIKMQKRFDLYKLPKEAMCGDYNKCLIWDAICADWDCNYMCPPPALEEEKPKEG